MSDKDSKGELKPLVDVFIRQLFGKTQEGECYVSIEKTPTPALARRLLYQIFENTRPITPTPEMAFECGYELGHNDTVESSYADPEEKAKDWVKDAIEDGTITPKQEWISVEREHLIALSKIVVFGYKLKDAKSVQGFFEMYLYSTPSPPKKESENEKN